MIAIDTHVLVHAHRADMPLHDRALSAVRECAEGSRPWGLPWPCVHEFLSIVTSPRVFKHPSTMDEALAQVRAFCARDAQAPPAGNAARRRAIEPLREPA